MMGVDSAIKTKVIGGIRAIMDNSKLGDYALGEEIGDAINLLYEARTNKMSVDDLLRSSDFVNGNARDRFSQISQALAQALEGKTSVFRELMSEYNDVARNYNTEEGRLGFYENMDKEDLIKQFINKSETIKQNNIKLYGEERRNSEKEDGNVPKGNGQREKEAGGGAGEKKSAESQQRAEGIKGIINRYSDNLYLKSDDAKKLADFIKDNYGYVKDAYDVWMSEDERIIKDPSDPNFVKNRRAVRNKEKDFESAVERMLNDMDGGLLGSMRNKAIEAVKIALGKERNSTLVAKSESADAYNEAKLDDARKAYKEAKDSGDSSEIKRTRDELKSILDAKYKAQGLGGQLVKYTTDTGEVKTGILMPDRFKPTDAATEKTISAKADDFVSGKIDDVVSSDGSVKLTSYSNWRGTTIELKVPKSKAKGGKYFLDDELRSMVDGNDFHTKGNAMVANVQLDKVRGVLDRLSSLGVKVREERKEGTHFRTDRSLQYSKTDKKDVKNSRIVPEDVDKSVSSQIEKKFDETINDISSSADDKFKEDVQDIIDRATSEYSNEIREVLEYEKTDYENEIAKLRRGSSTGGVRSAGGSSQYKGTYRLSVARANIAAIDRELAYRDARAKAIRDSYGLSGGSKITPDMVERIFKEGNPSKEQSELFTKAYGIAKRLGVEFRMEAGTDNRASGEADVYRNINLFLDGLVKTRSGKASMPRVLLHEMLHQATMGAINLVKSGKADSMLTAKQIEGVKTILDLYDNVKNDKERFKEEPYGLQNEYEFAAQMADPRQRKALDLDVWDRIKNAANELANKGDRSM